MGRNRGRRDCEFCEADDSISSPRNARTLVNVEDDDGNLTTAWACSEHMDSNASSDIQVFADV